jgi:hypothetical protein
MARSGTFRNGATGMCVRRHPVVTLGAQRIVGVVILTGNGRTVEWRIASSLSEVNNGDYRAK